jgi:hypothetical protein
MQLNDKHLTKHPCAQQITRNSFCSDDSGKHKVVIETIHEDREARGDLVGVDGL